MFYCLLATGFEEIEATTTVDILRRAGIDVQTVAIRSTGDCVTGGHGITLTCDLKRKQVSFEDIEGVILPGGMPGTLNLEQSDTVQRVINFCKENNKYICAICAAPQILGHLGILNGKKATCYPGFEGELIGAEIVNAPAVVDGKVITGKGPGATVDFAMAIVTEVEGAEVAAKLKDSMQCQK